MNNVSEAHEIREQIRAFRAKTRWGRLPEALQIRGRAYAQQRREQGGKWKQIASELGVHGVTAQQWGSSDAKNGSVAPAEPVLMPVVVKHKNAAKDALDRVEVEFPNGVRVRASGVGAQGLEQLMRMLGRLE